MPIIFTKSTTKYTMYILYCKNKAIRKILQNNYLKSNCTFPQIFPRCSSFILVTMANCEIFGSGLYRDRNKMGVSVGVNISFLSQENKRL